jgi:hypothetical protein
MLRTTVIQYSYSATRLLGTLVIPSLNIQRSFPKCMASRLRKRNAEELCRAYAVVPAGTGLDDNADERSKYNSLSIFV